MNKKSIALLKNILISARPNTWLRIWGEMIIAAALNAHGSFHIGSFLLSFLAASPLLWTAGYMLNDVTDRKLDDQHAVRGQRPIATGALSVQDAIKIIVILAVVSLAISALINWYVVCFMLVLSVSQSLYTLPPVRLKERPIFDITMNAVNSIARFFIGWFSQGFTYNFPYPAILMLVSIKIILFMGHRAQNKQLEKKNNIKSTITLLRTTQLTLLMGLVALITFVSYIYTVVTRIFPVTTLYSIIGGFPLLWYMWNQKHKEVLSQESSLDFRNWLYVSLFLWANIVALAIIFSRP